MNERDIHEVLEGGLGPEPPIVGGPAAVFAGAKARTRRTRMLTGALSVAAVLGIAAGAVAIGDGHSGSSSPAVSPAAGGGPGLADVAAGPATAPSTSALPGKRTGPGAEPQRNGKGGYADAPAPVPPPGSVLIDGRSTAEILKLVLPAGLTTSHYFGQDSYQPDQLGVQTVGAMAIDDGRGLSTIGANIQQSYGAWSAGGGTIPGTVTTQLPDGSRIDVYAPTSDKTANPGDPQAQSLSVDRVFANGQRIVVGVSNYFDDVNAPHPKGWTLHTTRTTMPLTVDQLKAIVSDPRWESLTVTDAFDAKAKKDIAPYQDNSQEMIKQ